MIVNVSKIVSQDLFTENESLVFDRRRASQYVSVVPSLSAITFIARKSDISHDLEELAIACGNEATALIKKMTDGSLGFWLFASEKFEALNTQNARIKDHQIIKYKKIWNEHLQQAGSTSLVNPGEKVVIESESFAFVAGLLDVSSSIPVAINAARIHPAYSLIVSRSRDLGSPESIHSIFSFAFPQEVDLDQMRVNWLSLAMRVCIRGDMLLRVNGQFDDREAAVDIIGTRETLLRLRAIVPNLPQNPATSSP